MKAFALFVLFAGSSLYADSVTDMERACLQRANLGFGKYWLIECLQEVFTSDPVHLTLGTIAPGAGTAAMGPAFVMIPRINRTEILLTGSALMSTDTSWLVQGQAVIALPPMGYRTLEAARTEAQRFGLRSKNSRKVSELDAKASLTLRARVFDAKEQWYYGLGPATSLGGQALYSLKEADLGAGFNSPFSNWSSGGVNIDYIRPRIANPNSGVPLDTLYTSASAPGIDLKDDFVQFEPYFTFKVPPRRSFSNVARVGFSFYHAIGDPRYSFRRLSASTVTNIPLSIPIGPGHPAGKRKGLGNFLCPTSRSGEHCSAGNLSLIARLDTTYSSAGSQSPFFFDPTLGGVDFQGNDTLRGFGDYRFRAPDRVLLQAEYRRPIWAFLGFVTFYDVGKVAFKPSDLALGQLRHDIGVGLNVTVGNHELARLYVAFGGGEPVQVQPKFGSLF